MTLIRELEEMIRHYAPHRPLKEIIGECIQDRDLPNDPVFYIEFQNTIANFYIRVCDEKRAAEEMSQINGEDDEAEQGKD